MKFHPGDRVKINRIYTQSNFTETAEGIIVNILSDNGNEKYLIFIAERGGNGTYREIDLTLIKRAHYANPGIPMLPLDPKIDKALAELLQYTAENPQLDIQRLDVHQLIDDIRKEQLEQ